MISDVRVAKLYKCVTFLVEVCFFWSAIYMCKLLKIKR